MADELAVNALAARLHQVCRFPDHKGPQVYWDCFVLARESMMTLGANGYVVVPRHLLDELLAAASGMMDVTRPDALVDVAKYIAVRRAVVEAVGPTT